MPCTDATFCFILIHLNKVKPHFELYWHEFHIHTYINKQKFASVTSSHLRNVKTIHPQLYIFTNTPKMTIGLQTVGFTFVNTGIRHHKMIHIAISQQDRSISSGAPTAWTFYPSKRKQMQNDLCLIGHGKLQQPVDFFYLALAATVGIRFWEKTFRSICVWYLSET